VWGRVGAAIGTALAMGVSSAFMFYGIHRFYGKELFRTLYSLWNELWPSLCVCLIWGIFAFALYKTWFDSFDPQIRYSIHTRIWPGIVSILIYIGCVVTMLLVQVHRDLLKKERSEFLFHVMRLKSILRSDNKSSEAVEEGFKIE
jgi:hypothetical protein